MLQLQLLIWVIIIINHFSPIQFCNFKLNDLQAQYITFYAFENMWDILQNE